MNSHSSAYARSRSGDSFEAETRHGSLASLAGARVLLVDDDEDERLIVRGLLRESVGNSRATRFSLDWVSNVAQALERIESRTYDVYLIDYQLGGESGLELIRRAVALGCEAPLILLTGRDDPSVDAEALRAGATDYLVKDGLSGTLLERTLRYAIAGKRSERELRAVAAQNARLLAAIEAASVGVALSEARDGDNVVTYVNPAFTEMTGYPPSEIIGHTLAMLGARETAPALIRRVHEQMQQGEAGDGLALNFRRDGTTFWNEGRFAPIPVAQGEPAKYVGFFQDVSARIEAEKAAREARQDLENAQALTHLGSWTHEVAPDGKVSGFWSDECYRILGLPVQDPATEARCETWVEYVHSDESAAACEIAQRALTGQTPFCFECRIVRSDGEVRHIQLRARREHDGDSENALRVVGTVLDITESARAESAQRELNRRLQAITQTAPIILWALDCNGVFTLSEGSVLQRLGLQPGQVVGQSIFEVYRDNAQVREICLRALDGQESDQIIRVQGRTFAVYAAPKWNEREEQIGVVGISYDITEQFAAQEALRESEARFERIMPNVPGVVFRFVRETDGTQRFDYVSPAIEQIFGVTPAIALGNAEALMGLVSAHDRTLLEASIEGSVRALSDWKLEMAVALPDGQTRWIRGEAHPIRRDDGSTVWDGILVDLTESKAAAQAVKQSQRALDEAQQLARVGSFTWDFRSGEALWSSEMYRMFELEPGAPIPTPEAVIERYHPDDRAGLIHMMKTRAQSGGSGFSQVRLVRRDGSIMHIETRSSVQRDGAGRPISMTGSLQDITERIETERALRESEERYALAMRGAKDGLWDWNLTTGEIYFSSSWKAMSGYAEAEIGTSPNEWMSLVHPEDIEQVREHLRDHLAGHNAQCECEYRLKNAAGEYRWMLGRGQALFDEAGTATRISGSQTDITERKQAEARLEHSALYDALTGLPNRLLFSERLDRTLARGNRHPDQTFAVLFLDIDRFKKVNDSLGHLIGDRLLIEAARRFSNCLRPGDTVARLGGDEFAVLLDDLGSIDDVHQVAERIHAELETPFQLDGHEAFVTVSMGIALSQGEGASAEELLRSADTAMYRAKGAGRGRHQIFEATMHARAVKLLEMETDLWRALERDELRLHYQPIISLESGSIVGMEALVRWQHPQRGLVSPADFIPLAEESGLIVPIGWWVLEEACRQAQAWQAEFGPLWMSVNLSPKQLSQADMLERVKGAIERSGFDANQLKLEITESVIMENTESAAQMLREIQALGVRFSMDDFGTGYSSLSYLHRFPLDTIKVDRSFVSRMESGSEPGARDHEIVNTIISMARGLKLEVVAEGVETAAQLQILRELKCGYAQGYFISKPQESAPLEALFKSALRW